MVQGVLVVQPLYKTFFLCVFPYSLLTLFKENLVEEETKDKICHDIDGAQATVTTTQITVNQRAASRPRVEGIDLTTEGAEPLGEFAAEGSTGRVSVQTNVMKKAVMQGRPEGVSRFQMTG